jgi:hypothetical protein
VPLAKAAFELPRRHRVQLVSLRRTLARAMDSAMDPAGAEDVATLPLRGCELGGALFIAAFFDASCPQSYAAWSWRSGASSARVAQLELELDWQAEAER